MKNILHALLKFTLLKLASMLGILEKEKKYFDTYQCEARSSSSSEFNCCVKKSGHRGMHMSADGQTWF